MCCGTVHTHLPRTRAVWGFWKNTSDSGNTKPCLSNYKPNTISTSQHSSHSSTYWQKNTNHLYLFQTWLFKLFTQYNHYEEHKETASLTWLMKRLLRFSLTVKTKDATDVITPACQSRAGWWGQGLCVTASSFHQPTYPMLNYRR